MTFVLDTAPVNASNDGAKAAKPGRDWQKMQFANLIRYVPSGTFYARFRVKGKLVRKSLKTDVLSVAKLRLSDYEQLERQRAENSDAIAGGKMTVKDAIQIHCRRVAARTREYHEQRIAGS